MTALNTTSQFLGSLGVNVHIEYTDGKYADAGNVLADLNYLGLSHVRDAALATWNQGQWSYEFLANAGIKFDMFLQGNPLSGALGLIDAFVTRHPGAVSMIEGPNEVNNFPITYNGLSGDAAATAYQTDLYAAVHADPALAGVPVANLTSWPDLAGAADYANFHSYPKNGAEPLATLSSDLGQEAAVESGKPMVMTEGGYTTLTAANYFGSVDPTTQAKLLLNMYMDNAKAGVVSSYIYELLDAYADPSNSDPNKHFGLFNLDNTPKPAAVAIHNLTTVLSAGADPTVAPSTLPYEVDGLPTNGATLDLTKSAAAHDLVLWNEPTIWNSSTAQAVAVTPTTTSLHFDDAVDVSVFDPLASTAATASYHHIYDLSLALTDHPLVVEVSDAAQTASTQLGASPSLPAPTPGALTGTDAADEVVASPSGSMAFGMGGADTLLGGQGADMLFGNMGEDTLYGGGGADSLFGGKDGDHLFGDAGSDMLFGNLGDDTLHGGTGADSLWGGQGNDVLFGDAGDDWLSGDLGDDTLTGGAGNDTFAFAPGSGHDVITDFTRGQDRIDVSAYVNAHDGFTIADDATGARISFATGETIEVLGVHASALTVSGGWIV